MMSVRLVGMVPDPLPATGDSLSFRLTTPVIVIGGYFGGVRTAITHENVPNVTLRQQRPFESAVREGAPPRTRRDTRRTKQLYSIMLYFILITS